jgi:integrase/recombinase XerD
MQKIDENPLEPLTSKQNSDSVRSVPENRKNLLNEERTEFFKATIDLRDRSWLHFIDHGAVRAHESRPLRQIDFQNREGQPFVTHCKGSAKAQVDIVEEERALGVYILHSRGRAPGSLFLLDNGRALCRWQIWSLMRRYCVTAGIDPAKAHPHALKHSCATHLAELGEDLLAIQDHWGDGNI